MADPQPTPKSHEAHGSYSSKIEHAEIGNAVVQLWVCQECHFIEAFCEHVSNSWDDAGENLTCNFCGLDGT